MSLSHHWFILMVIHDYQSFMMLELVYNSLLLVIFITLIYVLTLIDGHCPWLSHCHSYQPISTISWISHWQDSSLSTIIDHYYVLTRISSIIAWPPMIVNPLPKWTFSCTRGWCRRHIPWQRMATRHGNPWPPQASQEVVYQRIGRPAVQDVLTGNELSAREGERWPDWWLGSLGK